MSRSGYGDGEDSICYLWASMVERAAKGKRGQEFLRELETALLTLPTPRLIANRFVNDNGECCALGAVLAVRLKDGRDEERGMAMMEKRCDLIDSLGDETDYTKWACEEIDAPKVLLREVQHENDGEDRRRETEEERYEHVLAWVRSKIAVAK